MQDQYRQLYYNTVNEQGIHINLIKTPINITLHIILKLQCIHGQQQLYSRSNFHTAYKNIPQRLFGVRCDCTLHNYNNIQCYDKIKCTIILQTTRCLGTSEGFLQANMWLLEKKYCSTPCQPTTVTVSLQSPLAPKANHFKILLLLPKVRTCNDCPAAEIHM